ncbi:glycosyltransferase [Sphingobium sp. CR28]|uniref:glycosyltransferase n=1 Tax=Sphingobium sp. CR28 TaxID=3400272 RepID=UPI003FED8DFB
MTGIDLALAICAVLCGLLLVWPFVIYPLILRMLPVRPVAAGPQLARLSATLLFCAFNEAASLPAKIVNLRALKARHPELSILAYDDGSSDDTGALLSQASDVLTLVPGPGRTGKAHGMKKMAAMATSDILIFTDANVLLDDDVLDRLLPYYADPDVGGVLGSLRYHGVDASASAGIGALYWRLEEHLKDLESRNGNVMGADGSIFSVRRGLYPDFPDDVLDDLTVSMNVVFAGKRLIKANDVIAREAMVADRQDEYRRKIRIAARAWRTHRYLRANLREMSALDRFKYTSRKLVRWFGAVWLAVGALAILTLAWRWNPFAAMSLVAGGMLLFLAGLTMRRGPTAAIVDMFLAYVATAQGIWTAMRGANFTTWQPAKSRK